MKIGDWTIENDGRCWRGKRPMKRKPGSKQQNYDYKYWPRLDQAIKSCAEHSLPSEAQEVLEAVERFRRETTDIYLALCAASGGSQPPDLPASEVAPRRLAKSALRAASSSAGSRG